MPAARPRAQASCSPDELPDELADGSTAARSDRWVLTAVEFDVLWEWLRLGATPVVLRMDSPGHTAAARAGIVGRGWQALRERGLADASGPDPELVRLLNLLARPAAQLELRMWRGHNMRAVAAGRRNSRALAVRQDETVTVSECIGLPSALVDALPEVPAGPGRSVTVPTAAFEAATRPGPPTAGRAGSVSPLDARMLGRMLRGMHHGAHRAQIAALAADRAGVLRRLPKIVGVLDTNAGRYQLTRAAAPDGVEWTTLEPANSAQLRQRTAALLAEAREAAARLG